MESVAVTVTGKLPSCVGVPENVAPMKLIPFGKAPVKLYEVEPTPPVCVKVKLYAVPSVPAGSAAGLIVKPWQLTINV